MAAGRNVRALAVSFSTWCAACSGDDDAGADTTNLDDRTLSSLSVEEAKVLCDWSAPKLGGYGSEPTCANDDTAVHAAKDQAACVASLVPNQCSAKVRDHKACLEVVAHDLCIGLVTMVAAPECAPTAACGGS